MARQRRYKPKFGIVTLLVLLALAVFYNYYNKSQNTPRPEQVKEKRTKKVRKPKELKELRYLTVFTGKVIGIKDGDTFEVLYDGASERIRLADIDCPEKSQAFGKNARQYASDLCFGKTVTVSSNGKRDRYNRIVGTIVTKDGVNVNEALLKAGLAWHYKQYSKNHPELSDLEEQARQSQLGLWADKKPVAPWDWRKNKRKKKTAAAI
ncbi:nuclease [Flavobacterium zepuense]|uniref:Nuclease n=1 Tax=Flavobacterium zepuense TaxID=2593302 RepID=A0A552V2V8_9FLAO|nr:thermonuclease family protein [Flavobacterium zepuense]TRW24795.1 nuclease [Flavobacterium zepuense]